MRWFGAVPKSQKGSVVIERPKPAGSNCAWCSQGSKTPYHRAVACSSGPSPLPLLNAGASSSGESGAKTSCRGAGELLGANLGRHSKQRAASPVLASMELTSSGPILVVFMFWIETSEIYRNDPQKPVESCSIRDVEVSSQVSNSKNKKAFCQAKRSPSAFIGIETKRHCPSRVALTAASDSQPSREEENSIASQLPPN